MQKGKRAIDSAHQFCGARVVFAFARHTCAPKITMPHLDKIKQPVVNFVQLPVGGLGW